MKFYEKPIMEIIPFDYEVATFGVITSQEPSDDKEFDIPGNGWGE